jgi:hypothetical protein
MVAVQADCSLSAARVLIEIRAEFIGCDVEHIALSVLDQTIRFDA